MVKWQTCLCICIIRKIGIYVYVYMFKNEKEMENSHKLTKHCNELVVFINMYICISMRRKWRIHIRATYSIENVQQNESYTIRYTNNMQR